MEISSKVKTKIYQYLVSSIMAVFLIGVTIGYCVEEGVEKALAFSLILLWISILYYISFLCTLRSIYISDGKLIIKSIIDENEYAVCNIIEVVENGFPWWIPGTYLLYYEVDGKKKSVLFIPKGSITEITLIICNAKKAEQQRTRSSS